MTLRPLYLAGIAIFTVISVVAYQSGATIMAVVAASLALAWSFLRPR